MPQRGTFDVVFMDMRMPEMDGLAATRAIRALGGAWAAIPIIALTANAFAEDVKACREPAWTIHRKADPQESPDAEARRPACRS